MNNIRRVKSEGQKLAETLKPYQLKRYRKYKALNQLELQYDDMRDGGTRWLDAIEAIKLQYPKDS